MSIELDRFEAYTKRLGGTSEHWLWLGGKTAGGKYGVMFVGRTGRTQHNMAAHRFAWEHFRGEIPKGKVLTPNCNPEGITCVNPWHYDAITKSEASTRGRNGKFSPDLSTATSPEMSGNSPVEDCLHHWVIAPPNGPMSIGVCKHCGMERDDFANSIDSGGNTRVRLRKGRRVKDLKF